MSRPEWRSPISGELRAVFEGRTFDLARCSECSGATGIVYLPRHPDSEPDASQAEAGHYQVVCWTCGASWHHPESSADEAVIGFRRRRR